MLVDFVTRCTISEEDPKVDNLAEDDPENQWILYMDGSSNANGLGVGMILASPERDII